MQLILKTAYKAIVQDLMNNGGHTKQFDAFWDVSEKTEWNSYDSCKWQRPYSKQAPSRKKMLLSIWIISAEDLYK